MESESSNTKKINRTLEENNSFRIVIPIAWNAEILKNDGNDHPIPSPWGNDNYSISPLIPQRAFVIKR